MRTPGGYVLDDSADLVRHLLETGMVAVSPGLASGFDDLTVRLCFGCVGARHTYQASRTQELAQLATPFTMDGPMRGEVDGDPDIPPEELTAGFNRGRAEVTEGLTRISAAMATVSAPGVVAGGDHGRRARGSS
jgi:hypothetical protein